MCHYIVLGCLLVTQEALRYDNSFFAPEVLYGPFFSLCWTKKLYIKDFQPFAEKYIHVQKIGPVQIKVWTQVCKHIPV